MAAAHVTYRLNGGELLLNILVALNANYLFPLKVMLKSLFDNNQEAHFTVYMMYSEMTEDDLSGLESFLSTEGHRFVPLYIEPDVFSRATVLKHFTSEMYYRLIAWRYLPAHVDRILYLDPDIIVLNPIADFYHKPFRDAWFIASEHEFSAKIALPFNRLRLKTPKAKGYYNTGVLLMNMRKLREEQSIENILAFISENRHKLLLPDQDVFNALYWDKIIPVSFCYYNYDARYYELAKRTVKNQAGDLDWIRKNTVFIHYCGKQKPWQKNYKGDLGVFFRQYAERLPYIQSEKSMP